MDFAKEGTATMKLELSTLELIDLQSALRRATMWNNRLIEFYGELNEAEKAMEVYKTDNKRFADLHDRCEALFDLHYPPSNDEEKETAA